MVRKTSRSKKGYIWSIRQDALYYITNADYEPEPDRIGIEDLNPLFAENRLRNNKCIFWAKQREDETQNIWKGLIDIKNQSNFNKI